MLSPLDKLYLDTTSKEDLLAEINDQRRQVIEARGMNADASKLELELKHVKARLDEALKEKRNLQALVSSYRRKYNITMRTTVTQEIITLMEGGLRNAEIVSKGYNKRVVEKVRAMVKIKPTSNEEKAAQSI